ncbi:TPM domain-containing protein [Thermodesulfobacteriota bacterium]
MKDLSRKFLYESERQRIMERVKKAETLTSGEIVPLIVSSSFNYPMANVLGGALFGFFLALILTPVVGRQLWLGPSNMWLFIGFFVSSFIVCYILVKMVPWLKRVFISKTEMESEVNEAAITAFYREGLNKTRDETGILIFISVFEHKVCVLADKGINNKVHEGQWDEIVAMIIDGIKKKRQADAICEAIEKVALLLREHFPIRPDDRDELENLIVK